MRKPSWSLPRKLLVLVVWACGWVPGVLAGPLFTRGDANSDTAVNISDTSFILHSLFAGGDDPDCFDAADGNDDGGVDVSDAIYLLHFLFGSGSPPPPPSPGTGCHGLDPTADELGCESGFDPIENRPNAELFVVRAPARGVRQRSRILLPEVSPGDYRVDEGVSFALLVVAEPHPRSRHPISLTDPDDRTRGNPNTLRVVADTDLGDPTRDGAAAGTNLAPWFLGDLDPWSDGIYLEEHAALRIAGDGPLAPRPGTYTFTLEITDAGCGISKATTITLEVAPSFAPDVFSWTESTRDVKLAPRAHDEGSGSPRVSTDQSILVVIEAFPNGRNPQESPDPLTLQVVADSAPGVHRDITERFEPDPTAPARWSLWLEPGDESLAIGNTSLTISIGATGSGMRSETSLVLEVDVSHGTEIQPIWDQSCSGCHEGPNANKGLVLVAPGTPPEDLWRRIVNVFAAEPVITSSAPFLVRPYYPERSYLFHKLQGTHLEPGIGGKGDRMPLGGPPYFDAATLHAIRSWVLQGAGK